MASKFKIPTAREFSSLKAVEGFNGRIAVFCTVLSIDNNELSAIISDATAEAKLVFESQEQFKKARIGEFLRVFGTAEKQGSNVLINVESLQSFDSKALEACSKVRELEARFGVV